MYLQWHSFTPELWKRGILKTLLLRAHIVYSNQYPLEKEIKHLKHVCPKVNVYPAWVVRQITQKVVMERSQIQSSETIIQTANRTNTYVNSSI